MQLSGRVRDWESSFSNCLASVKLPITDSLVLEGDEDMHRSFFEYPFVFEHSLKYLLFSVAKK